MLKELIAGGISGVISRTATAPLELYKIQQQNAFVPHSTLRAVLDKEGIAYLWKGNGTNCVRLFPQYAINYAVFSAISRQLEGSVDGAAKHLLAGGASGAVAMTAIYPLETVRSRLSLQLRHSHYRGISDALRSIPYRQMYGGLRMGLLGFPLFNALNFCFYGLYKQKLADLSPSSQRLLGGGLAGVTAITVTYPTDLIWRRLQLQGFHPAVPQYSGILDCCRKIMHGEGARGLYRGLLAAYIKVFPTLAIQFWSMELCNDLLNKSI